MLDHACMKSEKF